MKKLIDVYPYRKQENNIEFLLLKRASKKIYAHQWRMVGGKVESDEFYWQAGLRELKEELDITPITYWAVPSLNGFYEAKTDTIHHIPAFAAQLDWDSTNKITLDEEHSRFLWVKASDIESYIHWPEQKRLIQLINELLTNQQILPEWIIELS